MFKRAAVRGMQTALQASGRVGYPDAKTAQEVADYIADRLEFNPLTETLTGEKIAEICNHLIQASNELIKQGYQVTTNVKVASDQDLQALAHQNALDVMQKAAEGSTIEGGDKGNEQPESSEGKMDYKNRPLGYAEDSRGKTEVDTKPGAVGAEKDNPKAPHESPAGSNSVTEQRTASLAEMIKKIAAGTGSTIMGGDKGNKEDSSAEAKMEKKMRPDGYALFPRRGTESDVQKLINEKAVVGKEQPHPVGYHESPPGNNSVIDHSRKAASEDDAFLSLFKKTANEVVPCLPTEMDQETKIAHVRRCMGLTTEEKAQYIIGLTKQAEMPPALAKAIEEKKEHGGKMPTEAEEKKEHEGEKKCPKCGLPMSECKCSKEEKKEASADNGLLARLREIAQEANKQ